MPRPKPMGSEVDASHPLHIYVDDRLSDVGKSEDLGDLRHDAVMLAATTKGLAHVVTTMLKMMPRPAPPPRPEREALT